MITKRTNTYALLRTELDRTMGAQTVKFATCYSADDVWMRLWHWFENDLESADFDPQGCTSGKQYYLQEFVPAVQVMMSVEPGTDTNDDPNGFFEEALTDCHLFCVIEDVWHEAMERLRKRDKKLANKVKRLEAEIKRLKSKKKKG